MRTEKMKAAIFDLDGTLSLLLTRKPYGEEQARCLEDSCREPLAEIARAFNNLGWAILLVSGRFGTYRRETMQWLRANNIPWDSLWMRDAGDQRKDDVLKEEIYLDNIEPYFDVQIVFDDRLKVIRMWRKHGLFVADVGNGVEF
jgi:hypothetical protein